MPKAKIILFKPNGKYYTEEEWDIPRGAVGPYDMHYSKDWHRIGGGPVLVETQEPWGYPHLFPSHVVETYEEKFPRELPVYMLRAQCQHFEYDALQNCTYCGHPKVGRD